MRQFPFSAVTIAIAARDSATAIHAVREAVRSESPNTPIGAVNTWRDRFNARTAEPRLLMTMLTVFGAVGGVPRRGRRVWTLLVVGRASQTRVWRFASRLARSRLASPQRIVRHSVVLVAVGLAAGWALVRAADTALATVLFGVSPDDAISMIVGAALLFVAALVASLPPALTGDARGSGGGAQGGVKLNSIQASSIDPGRRFRTWPFACRQPSRETRH